MTGLLRDLVALAVIVGALLGAAWLSGPAENYLQTGKTCVEITERLAVQKGQGLTPAEETDLANCTAP
jgi:hypothetical protein